MKVIVNSAKTDGWCLFPGYMAATLVVVRPLATLGLRQGGLAGVFVGGNESMKSEMETR